MNKKTEKANCNWKKNLQIKTNKNYKNKEKWISLKEKN